MIHDKILDILENRQGWGKAPKIERGYYSWKEGMFDMFVNKLQGGPTGFNTGN